MSDTPKKPAAPAPRPILFVIGNKKGTNVPKTVIRMEKGCGGCTGKKGGSK